MLCCVRPRQISRYQLTCMQTFVRRSVRSRPDSVRDGRRCCAAACMKTRTSPDARTRSRSTVPARATAAAAPVRRHRRGDRPLGRGDRPSLAPPAQGPCAGAGVRHPLPARTRQEFNRCGDQSAPMDSCFVPCSSRRTGLVLHSAAAVGHLQDRSGRGPPTGRPSPSDAGRGRGSLSAHRVPMS